MDAPQEALDQELVDRARRDLAADQAIAKLLNGAVVEEIGKAVNAGLEAELQEELHDALQAKARAVPRPCTQERYCRHVLRGDPCPFGAACRFRHFVLRPDGSVEPSAADMEREALTCGLCGNLLEAPVTLACGHSFDQACLARHVAGQRQHRVPPATMSARAGSLFRRLGGAFSPAATARATAMGQCPLDGLPFPLPLPEVDLALRDYVEARFPEPRSRRAAVPGLQRGREGLAVGAPVSARARDATAGAGSLVLPQRLAKAAAATRRLLLSARTRERSELLPTAALVAAVLLVLGSWLPALLGLLVG